MNRSAARLARLLCTITMSLGVPSIARAGSSDDAPARCTRPVTAVAAAPRVTVPLPSVVRAPAITAPRTATPTRLTRPGQSLTVNPSAPALTAKRNATPVDKTDKSADKPSEVTAPAVPGLGRLLRMNAGTDDEISWLKGPKDRNGAILT